MNYEEMSDLQINLLVANAIGVDAAENSGAVYGAVKHGGDNVVSVIGVVDYCNNPSDAWPIIASNKITVSFDDETFAYNGAMFDEITGAFAGAEFEFYCEKPLRAAMIVFLMMQEQAQ